MTIRFVALLLGVLVAACHGDPLPTASPAQDSEGKKFLAPPPGMGALYVYRTRSGNTSDIYIGSRLIGPMQGDNWLRVDLPPGSHDVRCALTAWQTMGSTMVEIRPGTISYVLATEYMPNCKLVEVDPTHAQAAIRAGTRIRELR